MTRIIDSGALDDIALSLQLAGSDPGEVVFESARLQQTLVANEMARRALTVGNSEGIFLGVMRNVHPLGAETIFSIVTPYEQTVGALAPWPVPVPKSLDVWLLSAATFNVAGGGVMSGALFLNYDARTQAFGEDDSGVAVVASTQMGIVHWDTAVAQTFRFGVNGSVAGEGTYPNIKPIRLQRGFNPGTTITFSSTASAASTWDCNLLLSLFPRGMGQDVIG